MGSYETNVSFSPALSYKHKRKYIKNKNETFNNIDSIKIIKSLLRIYVYIFKVYIYTHIYMRHT